MVSSVLSIVLVSSSIPATWTGLSSIALTLTGSSGLIELLGQPTEKVGIGSFNLILVLI